MTEPADARVKPLVAIVADDLTSAADGAGPFVEQGLACVVGCAGHRPGTGQVQAIDTGSRARAESEAARLSAAAVTQVGPTAWLYKTIDSTLRGHIRAELAAAFAASARRWLIVAPAFPAAGRTTVGGIQYVDGVELTQTHYADDPVHPARTARVAELLDTALGPVATVTSASAIDLLQRQRVLIVDASTQTALDRFVAEFPNPQQALWVGSPGMARALAKRVGGRTIAAPTDRRPAFPPGRRVLIVVGSLNAASRRQLEALRRASVPLLRADQTVPPGARIVAIKTPDALQDRPRQVLPALVAQATALIRQGPIDTLIATGGATMSALLTALDIREFELLGELEAGFPVAVAAAQGPSPPLLIALKAGGFGGDEALFRAALALLGKPAITYSAEHS